MPVTDSVLRACSRGRAMVATGENDGDGFFVMMCDNLPKIGDRSLGTDILWQTYIYIYIHIYWYRIYIYDYICTYIIIHIYILHRYMYVNKRCYVYVYKYIYTCIRMECDIMGDNGTWLSSSLWKGGSAHPRLGRANRWFSTSFPATFLGFHLNKQTLLHRSKFAHMTCQHLPAPVDACEIYHLV